MAIHSRELPRADASADRTPPPGMFGGNLREAWRSPIGIWIGAEYATDGWSICAAREGRTAERPTIVVPRHDCATLATLRQVLVPRTIRDNNGWTSVLYHPTNADRFIVGTETGVFLVKPDGDATAFAHCLDVQRLAITANGRCVFAVEVFPARGEMFALAGDELRSIGKLKPIGELIVHGERIFSRQSKEKAFEIVGGEAAWNACFGA